MDEARIRTALKKGKKREALIKCISLFPHDLERLNTLRIKLSSSGFGEKPTTSGIIRLALEVLEAQIDKGLGKISPAEIFKTSVENDTF